MVSLMQDGTVVWDPHIDVDAAAEAFGDSIKLGMEYSAGFDKAARNSMMRAIYQSLMDLADEKGSLTSEDLQNDLDQYIILNKLRE